MNRTLHIVRATGRRKRSWPLPSLPLQHLPFQPSAAKLFEDLIFAEEFPEFLTLPAYELIASD